MIPTEITQLFENASGLPMVLDDFKTAPMINLGRISSSAEKLLEAPGMKQVLNTIDWQGADGIPGPKAARVQFEATYRLLVACLLRNAAMRSDIELRQEATLAGTDLPAYKQQMVRTIAKAYPQLYSIQLFPFVPLAQSTGKIFYELVQYATAWTGSSPNIAAADDLSDLAKFNTDYAAQSAQLATLNDLKYQLVSQTVETDTYGVSTVTSRQAHHQMSAEYGRNLNDILSNKMISYLPWVIDRLMINAALAAVPVGNKNTWLRAPTINGVAWANQTPSEKKEYRETIWSDGILPIFTAMHLLRGIRPNWAVAGSNAAQDLSRLSSFSSIRTDDNTFIAKSGRLRDYGTLDNGGIRILIDNQLNADKILFGYRPTDEMEPAIVGCPWIPVALTDELILPRQLQHEKAAYTIFGIGQPTESVPSSAELGKVYGELTISNAAS
jgi:hypothetical protein